jgi:hypothetical protein
MGKANVMTTIIVNLLPGALILVALYLASGRREADNSNHVIVTIRREHQRKLGMARIPSATHVS